MMKAGGGMLGFSSLSKELRSLNASISTAGLGGDKSQVHPNSASRVSVDRHEHEASSIRRSLSISNNMVASSWHEGSQYLSK
jgi:hypothetical protein